MGSSDDGSTDAPDTKVGRLLAEYGLGEAYGAELETAWTADGDARRSLRELATEFNKRLLAAALREAGRPAIDGEVDNLYRLLTDEEVTAGTRTEARRRLERYGVDVDRLERDFVSYQAIRSYLREARGAEYDAADDADRVETTLRSVRRLRSRLDAVCESNLEQLRSTDRITLDDFRLFVSVDVRCEACGSQYDVTELLERGGCDCDGTGE